MNDKTQPISAVLGDGVAGLSTALYLQRAGHEITVIDPDAPGERRFRNLAVHGMMH